MYLTHDLPKRNRENNKIMNVMKENDARDPSLKGGSVDASESLVNQLKLVASLGYDSFCNIACIQKKQFQRRKTSLSFGSLGKHVCWGPAKFGASYDSPTSTSLK